ncbi:TetR/AcrR family transcriptional regulator [Sphingomonas sp.]|uniref:TetR/AcrR family transcriptional regulator n=1 Tax=Sphingomonas sp. TaxID=28214 RepID=UPI0025ED6F88|nr:TetR/AcrR family transcriptional regulator [Sphingomonas sp.]
MAAPVSPKPAISHQQRKSDRKRAAIIRAAIKVINVKSYALATMSEIAAGLDLRDATLYYYFENKQALAYACQIHSLEIFERLLGEAEADGTSGFAKLKLFIAGMLHDAEHNGPQLYFGDYSFLAVAQREHVGEWIERLTNMFERFLEEGISDGTVVPCEPKVVVQLLLGMLIWLAKWVPSIKGMTSDRLMDSICVASLNSLARPQNALAP